MISYKLITIKMFKNKFKNYKKMLIIKINNYLKDNLLLKIKIKKSGSLTMTQNNMNKKYNN